MSFILDALRKSEIERQRQSGPSIAELPVAREDRRLPVALLAIGVLLAVNVGVLLFFLLRDSAAPESAAVPPPVANATLPAAAPANNPPAAGPAPAMDPLIANLPPVYPDEPPAIYPSSTFPEPVTEAPDAPDPTLLPEAPRAGAGGTVSYGDSTARPLETMPTELIAGLPELTVDLHIFTDDAGKRAVFINGRRYTQGATIAEGPRVEEITRDGAVLSHRGRRFLLPRQ